MADRAAAEGPPPPPPAPPQAATVPATDDDIDEASGMDADGDGPSVVIHRRRRPPSTSPVKRMVTGTLDAFIQKKPVAATADASDKSGDGNAFARFALTGTDASSPPPPVASAAGPRPRPPTRRSSICCGSCGSELISTSTGAAGAAGLTVTEESLPAVGAAGFHASFQTDRAVVVQRTAMTFFFVCL